MKLNKQDKEIILEKSNPTKKIKNNLATLTWVGGSEIYNIKDMSKIWTDAQQKYLDERFNAVDKKIDDLRNEMNQKFEALTKAIEKKFDIIMTALSNK